MKGLTTASLTLARSAGQMDFLAALDDSVAAAAIDSLTHPTATPKHTLPKQLIEPAICRSVLKLSLRERTSNDPMPSFTEDEVSTFMDKFFATTMAALVAPDTTAEERMEIALWVMVDENHQFSFKSFIGTDGVDLEDFREVLVQKVHREVPGFKMPTNTQAMDWRRNVHNRIRSKASHNRSFGDKVPGDSRLVISRTETEVA